MTEGTAGGGAGFLGERPARLAEMAEYQKGSVVSRTLFKKETGSLTLFAFDAGQGLSEHTAPFDALVLLLEGEARIVISGAEHRLGAGEMILMPAGRPHSVAALSPFKMLLTMIRG